jgi:hypothetical protein
MNYNNGIWLGIGNDSHEKAELLARKLYDLDIPSKKTWFDELKVGLARQPTKIKNLDEFFSIKKKTNIIRLNLGRHELWQGKDGPTITFAYNICQTERKVDLFYWFVCDFEEGYDKVDEVFKEIYGKDLAVYPRS